MHEPTAVATLAGALPHLAKDFGGLAIRPAKNYSRKRATSPIAGVCWVALQRDGAGILTPPLPTFAGDDNPSARSNSVTRETMLQGSDFAAFRVVANQPSAGGRSGTPSLRGLRGGAQAPVRSESVGDALALDATAAPSPSPFTASASKPRRDPSADRPAGVPAEVLLGRGIRTGPDVHKSTLILGACSRRVCGYGMPAMCTLFSFPSGVGAAGSSVEPVASLSVTGSDLVHALAAETRQRAAEQPTFGPPPRRDVK